MATYTVGYFCYLCNDKNEIVKQKTLLLREAQAWRSDKHMGRADVCFEEYEALKHIITKKTEHIKEVGRYLKAKPIYAQDYSVVAVELKMPVLGFQTIAHNADKIKELAEQYIVESIILGNFEDKP